MSPASCQVVRKRSPTPALGALEGGRRLGVSLGEFSRRKHEGWGMSIPHNALYSLQMEKGGPSLSQGVLPPKVADCSKPFIFTTLPPRHGAGLGLPLGAFWKAYDGGIERPCLETVPSDP